MKTFLLAAALVGAVNSERAEHGLPQLKLSQQLTHSADAFAHRLKRRGEFRHERRIRIQRARYSHVGEVLALGTGGPAAAVQAWMDSPPHRRLILSRKFKLAGGGAAGKIRVLHLASAPSGRHSRLWPAAR
jgi:uncharacterized protein YkwD